jgi:ABC-type glycerol-3-phosphate transport system substrate-binding protein
MPGDKMSEKQFNDTFVSVAAKDLIFNDPRDGGLKIFGLPLAVDTLALYYNNDLYQDRVPSRGRPAPTWDGFKDDVYKLTKSDQSFERFEVAGTAMGRSDNIARAMDILYMLMLQYKVIFYNDSLSQAEFGGQQAIGPSGTSINPATEALNLYTSFGLASQKNYSWNDDMVESTSDVKEMEAFARGKVATIFGYSYLYTQIKDEIDQLKKQNVPVMNPSSIKISAVPQVFDPATSTEKRDAYANYFAETVSRNSEHPDVAWDFLMFMTSKDNLAYYNQKTHAPTSRRDLIDSQMQDPIYGVFAEQVGYAESLVIDDWDSYKNIFGKAISSVIATTANPKSAIQTAQQEINAILPAEGILPAPPVIPAGKKTTTPSKTTTTSATTTTAK